MISLRRFTMADATDEYWDALRNPDVNRHLDSRPWAYTRAGLEKRLAELEAGAGWMFSVIHFGVEMRETRSGGWPAVYMTSHLPHAVGTCTIRYEGEPFHGVAVFGLMIFPEYHGRGMGTATIKAATNHAFEKLYLRKLWAGVHQSNTPSARAFKSAGWTMEAVLNAHRREDHGSAVLETDVLIYGTWRDKWLASNAANGPRSLTTAPNFPGGSNPAA